jgi:cobalt-zinc-cadmium efflux system outer membrane protein
MMHSSPMVRCFARFAPSRVLLPVGIYLASSCVQVEPKPDFERARQLVEASTGRGDALDPQAPGLTSLEMDGVLEDGLSLDETLQLALMNSRELQAEFLEIGVAHADWVQSQLFSNPSLDFLLSFPSGGGRTQLELGLGMNLLEFWQIPVRTEVAKEQLDATVLRIARRAGERLGFTRTAYFAVVAAEELLLVAQAELALHNKSYEAACALYEAGVVDALEQNLARGPALTSQVRLEEARIHAANTKRELAKYLSISRPVAQLELLDRLPLQCRNVESAEGTVELALRSRLDLRALASEVEARTNALRLEEGRAWGEASVGASLERPGVEGDDLVGAGLDLSLPLFDQNQAQVARAEYRLEQSIKLHEAALIRVAQDVRASVKRVNSASNALTFYTETLLPHSESALELANGSFAGGRTTLLALIEVQRQSLEARRAHVSLRLEAVAALSELDRLVGATAE